MKIVWSPTAIRRGEAIVDFIKSDRPQAASDWLDELLERLDLLTELPEQGRIVPDWPESPLRELIFDPVRVIYEVFDDHIVIHTLSHFRQELSSDPPGGSS